MVCVSCAWEIISSAPTPTVGCLCASCDWVREARRAAAIDKFKVKQ